MSAFWRRDDRQRQKAKEKAINEAAALAAQKLEEQRIFAANQAARLSRSLGLPRRDMRGSRRFPIEPGSLGLTAPSRVIANPYRETRLRAQAEEDRRYELELARSAGDDKRKPERKIIPESDIEREIRLFNEEIGQLEATASNTRASRVYRSLVEGRRGALSTGRFLYDPDRVGVLGTSSALTAHTKLGGGT